MSKECQDLKDSFCNAHDDEDTHEGPGHEENRSLNLSLLEEEADNACRKNSKAPYGQRGKKDQSQIPQGHDLL